jgi:hypothetical protein
VHSDFPNALSIAYLQAHLEQVRHQNGIFAS